MATWPNIVNSLIFARSQIAWTRKGRPSPRITSNHPVRPFSRTFRLSQIRPRPPLLVVEGILRKRIQNGTRVLAASVCLCRSVGRRSLDAERRPLRTLRSAGAEMALLMALASVATRKDQEMVEDGFVIVYIYICREQSHPQRLRKKNQQTYWPGDSNLIQLYRRLRALGVRSPLRRCRDHLLVWKVQGF